MTRDSQKQKLYDAEHAVWRQLSSGIETVEIFGSTLTMPMEYRFGSLDSVRIYLRRIRQTSWWQRHYRDFGIPEVRKRKGTTKAHYEEDTRKIAMPEERRGIPWAMREMLVLHELAHHLTPNDPGHGPQYAGVFQHLVREAMGPEAGLMLAAAFDAGGVKWTYVMEKEGAA